MAADEREDPALLRCDFCGAEVPAVRRVALDADYERLRTPHRERFACPACSERKERERREAGERQR
jgi:hypothetical protein